MVERNVRQLAQANENLTENFRAFFPEHDFGYGKAHNLHAIYQKNFTKALVYKFYTNSELG